MPTRTSTRTIAHGLAALIAPLALLPLLPSAAAVPLGAQAVEQVPDAETSVEQVGLTGVDDAALAGLRTELVASLTPAPTELLSADPEAAEVPTILTSQLEVDPFNLAAVVWSPTGQDAATIVDIRLREGGSWSEWQRLEVVVTGPDADSTSGGTVGTDPLLSDAADGVQVRIMANGTVPTDPRLVLVDGGEGRAPVPVAGGAVAAAQLSAEEGVAAAAAPAIVTRAQWGADDRKLNGSPSVGSSVQAIAVHHTAGTNNYSADNAAAQVRSVYAYHTDSLNWSDIGYNFLVDKFGTVYEGRKGSITEAVQGAHSGGFNSGTMGIAGLGNYETAAVPRAMVDAIGRVAGWKLAQYGVDPRGTVTLTSAGGGTSRVPKGGSITLPTVFAHRQVGLTVCPGRYLFAMMDTVRDEAARYRASTPDPVPTPAPTPPPTSPSFDLAGAGSVPLAADIDGDGKDELGWFNRGWFGFRTDAGTAYVPFGRGGDIPVTGDWDQDGKDGIGVFRAGTWYVRDDVSTGPADRSFMFGQAGDRPVVGRWAGQDADGIGVVRGATWLTRRSTTGGEVQHSFAFGRASDIPVLGAWLNDGVARPGVVRGTTWHLATSIKNPVAAYSYAYGRVGDRPLVADIDGDGMGNATAVRDTSFFFRATHARTSTATNLRFTG